MKTIELLKTIEKHANYSTRDLADILLEDEHSIIHTLSQLEQQKIICGYHTIINWNKTDQDHIMSMIEIGAIPERGYGYDRIAHKIASYDEIDSLYLMSGKTEFTAIIYGKTMQEVADFVGSKLACIDGVKSTTTLFVLKQYKYNGEMMDLKETMKEERLVVTP